MSQPDRRRILAGLAASGGLASSSCAPLVLKPLQPPEGFAGPRFDGEQLVSFDGARLPLSAWKPEGEPWAVVVAIHGINDYAMAFDDDGRFLARAGVATYAYDQRGFGRGPDRGLWAGETLLTGDLRAAVQAARAAHPGAMVCVLGHSMGGAVAISAFASSAPPQADRLMLAAPAVWGWSAQPLQNRLALWLGAHMRPGAHLDPPAWLVRSHLASDNLPMLRRMGRDRNMLFSTRIDVVYGLVGLMQSALDRGAAIRVPTLYLYGAHDNLVPRDATLRAVRALRPADATRFYADGWHLLLRDLRGDLVRGDMLAWMRDLTAPPPSGAPTILSALTRQSG
jgi:alpha-beta hydrolase superfamily lysophospholipase